MTMVAAIRGSMIRAPTDTTCSVARPKVIECATVNAVMMRSRSRSTTWRPSAGRQAPRPAVSAHGSSSESRNAR